MKIVAINASPRKNGNTAEVLQHALDGAKSMGAETKLIHLYNLNFTGCRSCFVCKLKDGKSYGRCGFKDELTPILDEIADSDALIMGSPIYFGQVTGMLRCFEERLLFPFFTYTEGFGSIAPKKVRTAFVYTMNVTAQTMQEWKYPETLKQMEIYTKLIFGFEPEVLYVNNTVQFKDYSKYVCTVFSEAEKKKYREEHFPADCRKAYEIGCKLAQA